LIYDWTFCSTLGKREWFTMHFLFLMSEIKTLRNLALLLSLLESLQPALSSSSRAYIDFSCLKFNIIFSMRASACFSTTAASKMEWLWLRRVPFNACRKSLVCKESNWTIRESERFYGALSLFLVNLILNLCLDLLSHKGCFLLRRGSLGWSYKCLVKYFTLVCHLNIKTLIWSNLVFWALSWHCISILDKFWLGLLKFFF